MPVALSQVRLAAVGRRSRMVTSELDEVLTKHRLWMHQKGRFYHDGRFATLRDALEHYDQFFRLGLTEPEKTELAEYLKSL
jgi:hypothetical protein